MSDGSRRGIPTSVQRATSSRIKVQDGEDNTLFSIRTGGSEPIFLYTAHGTWYDCHDNKIEGQLRFVPDE